MKPILDWTKSKAEAYTPGAAPKGTFPGPFSIRFFSWNFRDCLLLKALRQSAAVLCDTNETRERANFKSLAAAGAL